MATGARTAMTMATAPMPIDPRLITLTQWLSPAYPVGAFTWSHGLEAAIAQGWIGDTQALELWLADLLEHGSGRADAVWIALAYAAADSAELARLDASARAFAPAAERLREAERQGAAFARVTRKVWALDLPDAVLPVALGRAARLLDMDVEAVAALYLHSFAANLVSAAQRLMPLGQTGAQRILSGLGGACAATAAQAMQATPDDVWSNAFLSDIAAMRHETQQPRLFQS